LENRTFELQGEYGDGHVRIALVENEHRIRQAARNVKKFLDRSGQILSHSRRQAPAA
jgi:alanine-synthesizing transaminase